MSNRGGAPTSVVRSYVVLTVSLLYLYRGGTASVAHAVTAPPHREECTQRAGCYVVVSSTLRMVQYASG